MSKPVRPMADISLDAHHAIERIQKWFERRKMRVPKRTEIVDFALSAGLHSQYGKQLNGEQ